jgi:hypothetical protein
MLHFLIRKGKYKKLYEGEALIPNVILVWLEYGQSEPMLPLIDLIEIIKKIGDSGRKKNI